MPPAPVPCPSPASPGSLTECLLNVYIYVYPYLSIDTLVLYGAGLICKRDFSINMTSLLKCS